MHLDVAGQAVPEFGSRRLVVEGRKIGVASEAEVPRAARAQEERIRTSVGPVAGEASLSFHGPVGKHEGAPLLPVAADAEFEIPPRGYRGSGEDLVGGMATAAVETRFAQGVAVDPAEVPRDAGVAGSTTPIDPRGGGGPSLFRRGLVAAEARDLRLPVDRITMPAGSPFPFVATEAGGLPDLRAAAEGRDRFGPPCAGMPQAPRMAA